MLEFTKHSSTFNLAQHCRLALATFNKIVTPSHAKAMAMEQSASFAAHVDCNTFTFQGKCFVAFYLRLTIEPPHTDHQHCAFEIGRRSKTRERICLSLQDRRIDSGRRYRSDVVLDCITPAELPLANAHSICTLHTCSRKILRPMYEIRRSSCARQSRVCRLRLGRNVPRCASSIL